MRRLALLIMLLLPAGSALAQAGFLTGLPSGRLCRPAIETAERRHGLPSRLLAAIGRVESGRPDPASGQVAPWPWTINAEGQGAFFDSKPQAIAAVRSLQARGVRSIDVGCMQVNLMHHPDAFTSLEQAFDPVANADYAARFLRRLFDQAGAWPTAAGRYHSATAELGAEYQRKVMAVWPEEQKRAAEGPAMLAQAWGATLPQGGHPILGRQVVARLLPLPSNGADGPQAGRGLDAYRAMPVTWTYQRPLPVPPTVPGPDGKRLIAPSVTPFGFLRR